MLNTADVSEVQVTQNGPLAKPLPPMLSPVSSASSTTTPSLNKTLSKKASLQKMLSKTKFGSVSVDSMVEEVRSDQAVGKSSGVLEENQMPSNEVSSKKQDRVKEVASMEHVDSDASLDIDVYCSKGMTEQGEIPQVIAEACEYSDISSTGERNSVSPPLFSEESLETETGENTDRVQTELNEPHSSKESGSNDDTSSFGVTNGNHVNIQEHCPEDMDTVASEESDNSPIASQPDNSDEEMEGVTKSPDEMNDSSADATSAPPTTQMQTTSQVSGSSTLPTGMGPPPIEILITFDTTGSMSYYLDEVKNQINTIINRLFMDIPNLKIGLIAHGDYCDADVYYLTHVMDMTNDVNALCEMVKVTEGTGGGDFAECYELIFRMARQVKWSPGSQRALIMIGDACPHTPEELATTTSEVIDWRVEAAALRFEMGVNIYGVQCQDHKEAGTFWQDLAALTHGEHLRLDKFSAIIDIIMAICYKEGGHHFLTAYEQEVRAREGRMLATELDQAFGLLRQASDASISAKAANPSTSTSSTSAAPKKTAIKAGAAKAPKHRKKVTANKSVKDAISRRQKKDVKSPQQRKYKKKDVATPTKRRNKKPKVQMTRHIRENVSEANLALNSLKWSPWLVAMSSDLKKAPALNVLNQNADKRAVYELAVQVRPRGKRIVVYSHVSYGLQKPATRWRSLVFSSRINKLISSVLAQGPFATVFIRRALLKKYAQVRGHNVGSPSRCKYFMNRLYDYVWQPGPGKHMRTLVKSGVVISKCPGCEKCTA